MKLLKYIALSGVLALGLTSCEDWLDVNTNPNEPNNESILVKNRLPWVQKQYTYPAGCANTRSFATCGGFYSNNGNMNNVSVTWNGVGATGLTTTPYQTWFVGTAMNVKDMYNKAEAENAYHYMGAAEVIQALGSMIMLDLYGEMPYEDALSGNPAPKYSDGKTIWEGCLGRIDHAIELFNMTQPSTATALAEGDIWNGGDVNKWIKLCYGLKARWLLRVTKNSEYYKPDEILAALDKAPKSNADNTVQKCFDVKGDQTDFLLGDPIMTNGNWNTAAYGKNQWVSKYHLDLLTNMRGAGVVDPRTEKIIPSSMTKITLDANGNVFKYEWRLSKGIDMFGDVKRLEAGGATSIAVQTIALKEKAISYVFDAKNKPNMDGFVQGWIDNGYTASTAEKKADVKGGEYLVDGDTVTVVYPAGAWYVDSNNYVQAGDTAYVNLCGGSQNTNNGAWGMPIKDTFYHSNVKDAASAGAVSGTGSYQIQAVSDFEVCTYSEMCFIKAEVLFRKGDKAGAYTAYKAGIQANMDCMQAKLNQWKSEEYLNPFMSPMDPAAINAYMSSAAVAQSAGELNMADIMQQKYIAMGWSLETWVDMRRFNYSAGNVGNFGQVYPTIERTVLFTGSAALRGTVPTDVDYYFRRWRLPATLELNYNALNALEMNPNCLQDWIWGVPVWWDCSSDAEYYKYLGK